MSTTTTRNDFSAFALFAAGLALAAGVAAAPPTNVPGGSKPTGPTLYTPANVTAGVPSSITWDTKIDSACGASIDLVLLKGPNSAHMVPINYVAQGVANAGNYSWTPSADLEASPSDYALELICVANKDYQYTARFGIANSASPPPSSPSSGNGTAPSSTNSTASPLATGNSTSPTGASGNATLPSGNQTTTTTPLVTTTPGASTPASGGSSPASPSSATSTPSSSSSDAAPRALVSLTALVGVLAFAAFAM